MGLETKTRKSRIKLLHQYYKYTGFYKFLGSSLRKTIIPGLIIVIALIAVDYFFIDLNTALIGITDAFSISNVLLLFFASESIFGLIPPEIFIAWAKKLPQPIIYLTILAFLSYLGGVVSYFTGYFITKIPKVKLSMENKMKIHIRNTKKWGGFLIVVGALLPIPYALTSMAAGFIKYRFKTYLLFGLLRFVRFYLYAIAIFNIVQ